MTKTTTQELNNTINYLADSLATQQGIIDELRDKLLEKVETEGTVGWEPSLGNVFFTGKGSVWDRPSEEHSVHGNAHKYRQYAEKHVKFQQLQNWIYQLALELNGGWEPDWSDHTEGKHYIWFNHSLGTMSAHFDKFLMSIGLTYFKDASTAQRAIEIINSWNLDYDFSA